MLRNDIKKAIARSVVALVMLATILGPAGSTFAAPPSIVHMPINMILGNAAASSTIEVMVYSSDDDTTPTSTPDMLGMSIHYKNLDIGDWATSSCSAVETDQPLHRCQLSGGVAGSATDLRAFQYYLKSGDGNATTCASYGTDCAAAEGSPYSATVYNSPSWWGNAVSGMYDDWAGGGTKDGRCWAPQAAVPAGQNYVYVSSSTESMAALGNEPNTWIEFTGSTFEKFMIESTSTDANGLKLDISGPVTVAHTTSDCVNKFISGATIFIEGTGLMTTSSDVNTTSTFGTFLLDNVPDGCWDVEAFKKGYRPGNKPGVCLFDTSTSTAGFTLPYGNFEGGGGDMDGAFVTWSMPMEGMMSAPTRIGIAETPIVINFSEELATSTASSTSNVLLKQVAMDGTQTAVAVELIYEGVGADAYSTGSTEAKIIISSDTELTSGNQYIAMVTDDVTDLQNNSVTGNDPNGGHIIFFGTGQSFGSGGQQGVVTTGTFGTGGMYMPPFVKNVMPGMGKVNVGRNTKIAIQFDQTMSSDSTVLSNNIQLWQLNTSYTEVSQVTAALALDNTQEMVIITPSASLTASTKYRIKVLGGMQSSSGMTMGPPSTGASMAMFETEFETGASDDAVAPTREGISLSRYLDASSAYTGVPTAAVIKLAFDEAIDPNTINTNTIYVRQRGSTTNVTASTEYDMMDRKVIWMPQAALNASTTYVLTLSASITDFTGGANAFAGETIQFTTTYSDSESPRMEFADGDDYSIAIGFSEAMNAAPVTNIEQWPSGSTKWQTSVLNPANYVVTHKGGTAENYVDPANANATLDGASGITLQYDGLDNMVVVKGLALVGTGFSITASNITDISGNVIQSGGYGSNQGGGPIMSSADTFGMGGGGGMFGPPPDAGAGEMGFLDFGGKDPRMMAMMPVGVWPMSMVAFSKTTYMIDIPISIAIPASGKIKIGPFPDDADISGAFNPDINAKYAHYDLNGPGAGKVVLSTAAETSGGLNNDGITISGQSIIVTMGAVATQANDFLHLEIDGIKNPDQGTYKVDIETQTAASVPLEAWKERGSNPTMPFMIMPAGKYIIVGHATSTNASGGTGLNTVDIFGGSPATGPFGTTTDTGAFGSSTDGEYKVTGFNAGEVMMMTEPVIAIGSDEYIAPMPEQIFLDDTTTADTPAQALDGQTGCTSSSACYYYKKLTLTKVSAADTPALVVYIYGNFDTVANSGVGNSDIDIFAGGPNGFRVKEVSLAADYSATPYSTTISLPATGDYHVGIGPAMPKGMMGGGHAEMPTTWMPPRPADLSVSGSSGAWTWVEQSLDNSATSTDDGLVKFTIATASLTVAGNVYDPAGDVVKGKGEVFAYSPIEMFGTGAHVDANGAYSINLREGFYKMGVFMPGAPPSSEMGVKVEADGTVYVNGTQTTNTAVHLYLFKDIQNTSYAISGTVYSDTSMQYAATNASVFAYRTDGPGHAETMSDSTKGTYTLYVGPGTWTIGAYLPSHGDLTETSVTLPLPNGDTSKSGLNFSPSASVTYVTVRERVWQDSNDNGSYDDGEGIARATVSVLSSTTDYTNNAVTDSNGLYETKVPADTVYDIEVWSPEQGELPPLKNLSVTSTDLIYTDFSGYADVRTEHATTVEITFYDSSGAATTVDKVLVQLDQTGAIGISNDVYKEGVATTTLTVATSTEPFIIDIEIEGIPKELLTFSVGAPDSSTGSELGSTTVGSLQFATTTVDGYEKITVTLPEISYISGTVQDTSGAAIGNTMIHVEQPGTDIEFDVETDSSGNYSFKVASSTTPYLLQADGSGYIDTAVSVTTGEDVITFNPEIQKATSTVSGSLTFTDANGDGDLNCYAWAERLGGGYAAATGTCNAASGTFSVPVIDGDWEVTVVVEGKTESTQTTIAQVADGANVSDVSFTVSSDRSDITSRQDTVTMTGNVGGRVVNEDSGFELNIPRSALSTTDSSSYNVKGKEISNVPSFTPTGNLVGNKADEITAYKQTTSGTGYVSGLNDAAFVDKVFTKTELAAEGIDTVAEVEQTKMGYYESTVQNWTNMPTTLSYLDANDQPVIPQSDLSNVEKVVFNGAAKHFSIIGVTNTKVDGLPPAAPTVTSVQSETGGVRISWNAVTTNTDGTSASDIVRYNIYRSTSPNATGSWTKVGNAAFGTNEYLDVVPVGATTYYYRVTADSGLQSSFSSITGGGAALGVASAPGSSPSASAYTEPSADQADTGETADEAALAEETAPEQIAMVPEEAAPSAEETTSPVVEIPTVTFAKPIAEMTAPEIAAKITEIVAVINQLKEMVLELEAAETAIEAIPSAYKFETTLQYGQTSDDVTYLQEFLKAQGAEIYPDGLVTGWFGPLTKAAVKRFQEKYSADILASWELFEGTGLVGSTTRAKINEILGR